MPLFTSPAGRAFLSLLFLSAVAQRAFAQDAPGPCDEPAAAAIVDRPGSGRSTANNGSPCVVPQGRVLLEDGYRAQSTDAPTGTSSLETFPIVLMRAGLGRGWELIFAPPTFAERRGAALGGTFVPLRGWEDIGAGAKRVLDNRPAFQDAFEVFVSVPSGMPQGESGFSAGASTYTVSYTANFALSPSVNVSLTENAADDAAPNSPAGAVRYFSYQPSITVTYGFSTTTALLASDEITLPIAPGAGTGNRILVALQRALSRGVVIDVDYELNALPAAPAVRQHSLGAGFAVLF